MWQFTTLGFTHAGIAEVRAFEDVSLGTLGALVAITIDAESAAYRGSWRHLHMSIPAVRVRTITFGKVQASGGAFGAKVMREITRIPKGAFSLLEKVLAGGDPLRVMKIAAPRAVGAGTWVSVSGDRYLDLPNSSRSDVVLGVVCLFGEMELPVMENILQGTSTFLTAPVCLED